MISILEIQTEVTINFNFNFTTYIVVEDWNNSNEKLANVRHS